MSICWLKLDDRHTVSVGKQLLDLFLVVNTLGGCAFFDFCRMVRKESEVPIIFLTASDEEIILFSLYLSVGEFFIMDDIKWYITIWGIVVSEKRKYALFFGY